MKRLIYIIAGLFLIVSSCEKPSSKGTFGNPLLRFYGDAKDDIGYSIAEAQDGYVICGKLTIIERGVNESGSTIIVDEDAQFGLIKTARNGIQQWTYVTGEDGFDEGRKVISLDDGSFVCAGTVTLTTVNIFGQPYTHRDVIITKISATGEMVWESTYGDEQNTTDEYFDQEAYDLIEDPAGGGFLIVGADHDNTRTNNGNATGRNMYILAVNNQGDYIDSYQTGSPEDEFARSVSLTPDGYFLAVGTTEHKTQETSGQDGLNIMTYICSFSELNGANDVVYGGAEDEYVTNVVPSATGNAIVGTREFGLDSKEGLFVDLEVQGIDLPRTLTFSSFDLESSVMEINTILSLSDGGYLVSGNTGGTDQSGDMFFMFLDDNGNNISSPETFITGGTGLQSINDAIIDSDGKVVAVGINAYENNSLIALIKFDPWE